MKAVLLDKLAQQHSRITKMVKKKKKKKRGFVLFYSLYTTLDIVLRSLRMQLYTDAASNFFKVASYIQHPHRLKHRSQIVRVSMPQNPGN